MEEIKTTTNEEEVIKEESLIETEAEENDILNEDEEIDEKTLFMPAVLSGLAIVGTVAVVSYAGTKLSKAVKNSKFIKKCRLKLAAALTKGIETNDDPGDFVPCECTEVEKDTDQK